MEPCKQYPWGRCETCGDDGNARDDLTHENTTERRCRACCKKFGPPGAPNPLHLFCYDCGWRRGGVDSWDGIRCKCGKS